MLSSSPPFTEQLGRRRCSSLSPSALGDGQKASRPQAARLPADRYLRSMNRISMMSRKFLGSGRGAGERRIQFYP